jgi:hypothetical protein
MSQELTSAAGTERTSTHTAPGVTADDQAEIDFWTAALEEHSNRAMLNISRESLTRLLGIVGKLRTEQRTPQLDLGERETWLTVEQEVNRDLVGSLQILERFTGTAEEKRFHAKKVRGLFARLLASRSVISSASPLSDGVSLIAAERKRQVEKEGWTPAHDDEHTMQEIALAAAVYAWPQPRPLAVKKAWPWDRGWFKPTIPEYELTGCGCRGAGECEHWGGVSPDARAVARIRDLTKAGALIAAEIDRLSRLSASAPS